MLGNDAYSYFSYDTAGRLTVIDHRLPGGGSAAYFAYDYDAASRITAVRRDEGLSVYYAYDSADRLTGETWYNDVGQNIYGFIWDYGAVGNRVSETLEHEGKVTYFSYNAANELAHEHHVPEDDYSYWHYDRGNCVRIEAPAGTTYFEYNSLNLMASVRYRNDVVNYFHYDALGRRYAVTESTGTTYLTYDTDSLCALVERDSSGNVTAEYTRGYAPLAGIGDQVGAKIHAGGATYYQYPEYDTGGRLMRISNAGGTVTGRFEYNAFWPSAARRAAAGRHALRLQRPCLDAPERRPRQTFLADADENV